MSNIRYNEEQEAYELPYKLWNETMTVRFYAESESAIMSELPRIAEILETINGSRKSLLRLSPTTADTRARLKLLQNSLS